MTTYQYHCRLKHLKYWQNIPFMEQEAEYTDEFEIWWDDLNEPEQVNVSAVVQLLEAKGS